MIDVMDETQRVIDVTDETQIEVGDETQVEVGDETEIEVGDESQIEVGEQTQIEVGKHTQMMEVDLLSYMVQMSVQWWQLVAVHKYTVALRSAIHDFTMRAVMSQSMMEQGDKVGLMNIVKELQIEFYDLQAQAKPFVKEEEEEKGLQRKRLKV